MSNQEIPSYEKISNLDDFGSLYSEPAKGKVLEYLNSHKDALESFDQIKTTDKAGYFETIKAITDLIAEDYFSNEELDGLVQIFGYIPEEQAEVARWNDDYSITLNKKLYKRNAEGEFIYNINHDICHEIGHSIIELAEDDQIEFPSEIHEVLNQIDLKYESQYIQECLENGTNNEIVQKERLAEIFGFFLTCNKNKEEFCRKRILAMADKELVDLLQLKENMNYSEVEEKAKNNKDLQDLLVNIGKIFDLLSNAWPNIRKDLGAFDLAQYLENKEEVELSHRQEKEAVESSALAQEVAPESLNTEITKKDTGKPSGGYAESDGLGKNSQRSEGFLGMITHLVKDFAAEVPNVAK